MTQFLPPSLLALFAPRPPIPYLPPPEKNKLPSYTGVAQFTQLFEDETKRQIEEEGHMPLNRKEYRKLLNRRKVNAQQKKNEELVKLWDPHKDQKTTGDPYKTLFIAKLSYNTSEHKLKREFEMYGPVKKVRIVQDQKGKPRGYGFVEFEKERDMRAAYKQADGKKIDGRRIIVDTEKGRASRGWRPRRLGGGIGYSRASHEEKRLIREREASLRGDRDRERDRSRERDRDHKDKDRDRGRDHRDKDRDRHHRDDRKRERSKSRERDRERERERERERDPTKK